MGGMWYRSALHLLGRRTREGATTSPVRRFRPPLLFVWGDLTAGLGHSRPFVFALAALLIAIITVFDLRTTREVQVGFFHLAPITYVAWFAGRRAGFACAVICAAGGLLTDFLHAGEVGVLLWNGGIRLVVFLLVVSYQVSLRDAFDRERHLARRDPLTGVANLRMFREELERELVRCRRYPHPFTVAMVDLDDFKRVNDTQGHETGNAVLRFAAELMRNHIRATDTCARIGGDEFALLLRETSHPAALTALGKIRDSLRTTSAREGLHVTASIGAVTFDQPPNAVDDVVSLADDLMYQVKGRAGKDSVAAICAEHVSRIAK